MAKRFQFINNEHGFFLPLVSIMSLIILIIVTTCIKMYQNEIVITKNLINNLQIDTVIQMSLEQFKQEVHHFDKINGELSYSFPNNHTVDIKYTFLDNDDILLDYRINIADDHYEISQFIHLQQDENDDELW